MTKIFIGRIVYEKGTEEKYLVAQTNCSMVCLINLSAGNRYLSAVEVKDARNITPEEFKEMGGEDFYL